MKRIALITGASKGLGLALTAAAAKSLPEIEEFWLVSRHIAATDAIAAACTGKPVRPLSLDLCDKASFDTLREALESAEVEIVLLINNAGCGFLNNVHESPAWQIATMTELNVRALSVVTTVALPHMARGGHVLNVSSIAAFCPNARMTTYSATKAYVSAFSRGLREELLEKGISVTVVCPGPMETDFLITGANRENSKMFATLPYCDPEKVAAGAMKAVLQGRAVYTPRAFFKLYRVLAKVLPEALVVKLAKT